MTTYLALYMHICVCVCVCVSIEDMFIELEESNI